MPNSGTLSVASGHIMKTAQLKLEEAAQIGGGISPPVLQDATHNLGLGLTPPSEFSIPCYTSHVPGISNIVVLIDPKAST